MDLRWVSNPATFYPMAPNQGFEPRPFESESNVLPLHQFGRLAGAGGFEPPNTGSKPAALPITLRPYVVRVEGLEPPTSCSQSRRASQLRYTRKYNNKTLNILLYQLSYLSKLTESDLNRWHICICCMSLYMEQVVGIEPASVAWQATIITIILYLHKILTILPFVFSSSLSATSTNFSNMLFNCCMFTIC